MITIIVPVYNAESTLQNCLKSLLTQSYSDIEIILVDDGSTDSSSMLCDNYANQEMRVRAVHQPNKGVSAARNQGLRMARGEYIAFCDADDWMEVDWLECMVREMNGHMLIIQSIRAITTNGMSYHTGKSFIGSVEEHLFDLKRWDVLGYLFNKLFDAQIIREYNLLFDERFRFREDEDFVLKYMLHIQTVMFIERAAYNYMKPDLSTKYSHLDNFYTSLSMFQTVKDIFKGKSKSDMLYLQELTHTLFISFQWPVSDCKKRLGLYQKTVKSEVLKIKDLSFLTRILCLCPTFVAAPLFLIKARRK